MRRRPSREFDSLSREPFVAFLEPPSLDDRIVNQFALFSLMSSARAGLDSWLAARPHVFHRLIVPAGLKWEVRDKLDQANITERVLYPALDGLSRWLRTLLHVEAHRSATIGHVPCLNADQPRVRSVRRRTRQHRPQAVARAVQARCRSRARTLEAGDRVAE